MPKRQRVIRYGGAMLDNRQSEAVVKVRQTSMAVGEQVTTFEARCAKLPG